MAVMTSPETLSMVDSSHDSSVNQATKDISPPEEDIVIHTKVVPVKSGRDNSTRSVFDTQNLGDAYTTSRPSSSGEDLPQEEQDFLNSHTADRSANDVAISVKTIEKPVTPNIEVPTGSFKFSQRPTVQTSRTVDHACHEKPNQQHQNQVSEQIAESKTRAVRARDTVEQLPSSATPGLLTPILSDQALEYPTGVPTTSSGHSTRVSSINVVPETVLDIKKHKAAVVMPPRRHSNSGTRTPGTTPSVRRPYKAPPRATRPKKPINHSVQKLIPVTVDTTMEEEDIFKIVDDVAPVSSVRESDTSDSSLQHGSHAQSSVPVKPTQADISEAEVKVPSSVEEPEYLVENFGRDKELLDCAAGGQPHATGEDQDHQTAQSLQLVGKMPQVESTPTFEGPVSSAEEHPPNSRSHTTVSHPVKDQSATKGNDTKFPLHKVSDQWVKSKVTKRKASSTKGKPSSREPTSSLAQFLGRCSAEELLERAKVAMQQEKLKFLQEAAAEIDSKTAEIQLVCEQNQDLVNRLREMQAQKEELQKTADAERQKLTDLHSKAGRYSILLEAMDKEFEELKSMRAGYDQELKGLQPIQADIRTDLKALGERAQHTATGLERMNAKKVQIVQKSTTIESLTEANAYLRERLSEKVGMLSEERDRHLAFNQQLKDFQAQQKFVQDLFGDCTNKIMKKLAGLENLLVEDKPTSELLDLVKRCSEESKTLVQQGDGSVRSFGEVKERLEGLSSAVENHFIKYRESEVSHTDARNQLENRVITTLESVKTDFKSQDDLASKNAALRESITRFQEQLQSSKEKVNALESQISERDENAEAKTELVRSKTRLDDMSTTVIELKEQKKELQRELYVTKHLLDDANRARANFEEEKDRIEKKAEKDVEDQRTSANDQAAEVAGRNTETSRRILHEKEAMGKELKLKTSELERMTAELERTNEAANGRDISAMSLELEDLKNSKGLIDDHVRGLQEELNKSQADRRETDTAAKEQATLRQQAEDKLRGLQDQLNEVEAAKRGMDGRFRNLEAGFKDESQERQREVAELRRDLETANNRLTQQQSLIAQKDEALTDLKRRGQTQTQPSFVPQSSLVSTQSSQPSEVPGAKPQSKKPRIVVNRNVRTRSQTTESAIQSQLEQSTYGQEGMPDAKSSKMHASIFGPFGQRKHGPVSTSDAEHTQQDEDDMLNLDPSYPDSEHPGSRPDTSQSEFFNAHSLGSQEILDENGVRFVGSQRDEHTQVPSSPLSSVPSHGQAMDAETQDTLERSGARETQQSLGDNVEAEDQSSQSSQSEHGSPQKTVRGKGRKVTPRPESRPKAIEKQASSLNKSQRKPSIVPPLKRYGNTSASQKKISNLDSGPYSFTNTRSSKDQQVRSARQEVADDTTSGSDPVSGLQRTPKRPAHQQRVESAKRARTGVTTPSLPTPGTRSQQSGLSSPRRVGTPQRSGSRSVHSGSSKTSKIPGAATERRRSGRNTKLEQDMSDRFNVEMTSQQKRSS